MTRHNPPRPRRSLCLLLTCCLLAGASGARAQDQNEEVVRVSAELVQTDVTVLDAQGRFVDDLKPEQFELKVDGKPVTVSFFERVTAGSFDEDAQLAAARGGRQRAASAARGAAALPLDRGRVVAFFVDDLHLSLGSLASARTSLNRFIDSELGQNDQALIATASGQLGFLQQLTGDKAVLRRAASRLQPRLVSLRDLERPPMSEGNARAIENRNREVLDYFVERLMLEQPGLRRESAEQQVMSRASLFIRQADAVTINTLSSLESLVRASAQVPGRKLVFFVSEGFYTRSNDTRVREGLRRIAAAAARAGVVFYTLDARGLSTGLSDASTEVAFDPTGRLSRAEMGDLAATQEPLYSLAADTGGRAIVNTNAFGPPLTRALKETSTYYLLAWRPADGEAPRRGEKAQRIEASVKGRPDLKVIIRRGLFDADAAPAAEPKRAKDSKAKPARPAGQEELLEALRAPFPLSALPVAVSLGHSSPRTKETVLAVSIEVNRDALDYGGRDGSPRTAAEVEVLGVVLDADGKSVNTFKHDIQVRPPGAVAAPLRYSHTVQLAPGLYQVRVAARDRRSARAGSASAWVEAPDLALGRLALSSVFVGEQSATDDASASGPAPLPGAEIKPVALNASRRFTRDSRLRFVLHIYNAKTAPPAEAVGGTTTTTAARPDVVLQVQVFRDDQPVITSPLNKVSTDGVPDPARIPYAAEVSLDNLPAGRYALQVTAIDRVAKTSATERINFTIE